MGEVGHFHWHRLFSELIFAPQLIYDINALCCIHTDFDDPGFNLIVLNLPKRLAERLLCQSRSMRQ